MRALAVAAEGGTVVLLLALGIVGTLHLLPTGLLAWPAFTVAYGVAAGAVSLRALWAYCGWRRVRLAGPPAVWVRVAAGVFLVPTLAVGLVAAVVYLRIPFWPPVDAAAAGPQRPYAIYLVKHTWHTSIATRLEDIGRETWPDPLVRGRTWVDHGWGDEGFFQSEVMTVPLTLDALLTPGPAVLHIGAFDVSPEVYFAGQPVIRLEIGTDGMRQLVAFLRDTYALGPDGPPVATGYAGYYRSDSYFVHATGAYYFPNTCNVWTARALRAAGVPVSPALAVTAENLMFQASRIGTLVS